MKKIVTGTIALSLAVALTGCSKSDTPTPAPPGTTTTTTTPTETPSDTPTDTPSETPSDTSSPSETTPTGDTSSPTAPVSTAIDQSTPEAAMTSWLNSMVAGKSKEVCDLMAANGKPIADLSGASDSCAKTIDPMLDSLKSVGSLLENLSIKGATVKGNTATFDSATTSPTMAASIIKSFKAVKINGKWYVTQ